MQEQNDMFMEEKMMWKVGQCIYDLRVQKNLSQQQLADLSMIPQTEMHQIENGYQLPDDLNLHLMAMALDVYPSSILKADPVPRRTYWEFMELYDRTMSLLDQVIEYNQAYMKVIDEIVADYPQMQSYLAAKLPKESQSEERREEQSLTQNPTLAKEENSATNTIDTANVQQQAEKPSDLQTGAEAKPNKPDQQTPKLGGF
ncbi:MAG: helix-turn-helix transcriptional regulator [Eubacteriales bacterium]|nr:helix-turn-helix transcriptional regulator [Eubacteriales bacterium]